MDEIQVEAQPDVERNRRMPCPHKERRAGKREVNAAARQWKLYQRWAAGDQLVKRNEKGFYSLVVEQPVEQVEVLTSDSR